MSQQNNLAAQCPIDVRCKCGWHGKSDALQGATKSQALYCPSCGAVFVPYPANTEDSVPGDGQDRL